MVVIYTFFELTFSTSVKNWSSRRSRGRERVGKKEQRRTQRHGNQLIRDNSSFPSSNLPYNSRLQMSSLDTWLERIENNQFCRLATTCRNWVLFGICKTRLWKWLRQQSPFPVAGALLFLFHETKWKPFLVAFPAFNTTLEWSSRVG